MQFGIYASNFGAFADPQFVAQLAQDAEEAGWAGFFLSDNLLAETVQPVGDTWTTLAAMAARTERIRLGPLITALPRRHLGKLARESVTLDRLSGGRLTLGVGSGDDAWGEYSTFGPAPPPRELGEMLDDGLAVLTGLWGGQRFSFHGAHYQIADAQFLPVPVQQPRIPIWIAGRWPHKRPFQRAARWDGVYPNALYGELSPADYQAIRAFVREQRTDPAPFDIAHGHSMVAPFTHPSAETLAEYAEAGVTWWLASFDEHSPVTDMQDYIGGGPPAGPNTATDARR